MKRGTQFLALCLAALVAQGAVATFVAPPWCPDLALLVVIALGLRWERFASGLLLAALVGYATDLLSGSLLGQHALLNLFVFGGTMLATRQLNLRGAWPLSFFAAGLSLSYGSATLAITVFFVGGAEIGIGWLTAQLIHALVVGLFAPLVSSVVGSVFDKSGEQDLAHRSVNVGETA